MLTRFSEHRFTLLLTTLLLLMLVAPAVQVLRDRGHGDWSAVLITLLFSLVLLAAIPAVSRTRGSIAMAVILVGPAIMLRALDVVYRNDAVQLAHLVSGSLFFVFAIVAIMRYLIDTQRVTSNTISASLCVYMLLGVFWATVYSLLELLEPGTFSVPAHQGVDPGVAGIGTERTIDLLYYSFTTLTTLGYGDILPVSAFARMFAVTEAVVGQVILVVLVAHLVGLRVAQTLEKSNSTRE
jgi:hypothetical protein